MPNHIIYLGFDLGAATRIPFRVQALPPRTPAPSWAETLLAALTAAGLLLFVGRPVSRTAEASTPETPEVQEDGEKEALIVALQDLEHDFETGKLSNEDRDRLRRDLRREALSARSRQRGQARVAAPVESTKPCRCGRVAQPGDRFCAACGSPL